MCVLFIETALSRSDSPLSYTNASSENLKMSQNEILNSIHFLASDREFHSAGRRVGSNVIMHTRFFAISTACSVDG